MHRCLTCFPHVVSPSYHSKQPIKPLNQFALVLSHKQDVDSTCSILVDGQELVKGRRAEVKAGQRIAMGSEAVYQVRRVPACTTWFWGSVWGLPTPHAQAAVCPPLSACRSSAMCLRTPEPGLSGLWKGAPALITTHTAPQPSNPQAHFPSNMRHTGCINTFSATAHIVTHLSTLSHPVINVLYISLPEPSAVFSACLHLKLALTTL